MNDFVVFNNFYCILIVFFLLIANETRLSSNELSGSTSLTIKAVLKGGQGACGWQHAQLFRQSTNDNTNYPFHVHITFKNK